MHSLPSSATSVAFNVLNMLMQLASDSPLLHLHGSRKDPSTALCYLSFIMMIYSAHSTPSSNSLVSYADDFKKTLSLSLSAVNLDLVTHLLSSETPAISVALNMLHIPMQLAHLFPHMQGSRNDPSSALSCLSCIMMICSGHYVPLLPMHRTHMRTTLKNSPFRCQHWALIYIVSSLGVLPIPLNLTFRNPSCSHSRNVAILTL